MYNFVKVLKVVEEDLLLVIIGFINFGEIVGGDMYDIVFWFICFGLVMILCNVDCKIICFELDKLGLVMLKCFGKMVII